MLGLILIFIPAAAVADDEETERRNHEAWEAETKEAIRTGEFEFKPIKIVPSPIDGCYVGHFSFINKRPKAVLVFGFDEPDIEPTRFDHVPERPRLPMAEGASPGQFQNRRIGFSQRQSFG